MRANDFIKEKKGDLDQFPHPYDPQPQVQKLNPADPDYKMQYANARNWAARHMDAEGMKRETLKYLADKNIDIDILKSVHEGYFNYVGGIAWILNNGGKVSQESMDYFKKTVKRLEEPVSKADLGAVPSDDGKTKEKPEDSDELPVTAAGKATTTYTSLLSLVTAYIRQGTFDREKLREMIKKMSPTPRVVRELAKDVEEYSAGFAKTKDAVRRANDVLEELSSWGAKTKAIKTKIASTKPTRAFAKPGLEIPYLPYDESLNITSIDPKKVAGARALLTFIPETRVLNFYLAADKSGISFRGKKVSGFDPAKSASVKLRKPKESLPKIKDTTLSHLTKLFSSGTIKGKIHSPRPTMKDNTIILQVLR